MKRWIKMTLGTTWICAKRAHQGDGDIDLTSTPPPIPADEPLLPMQPTFYKGPASQFVAAILAKRNWDQKVKDRTITERWCAEFVKHMQSKEEGLDREAAARVASAALLSLRRSAGTLQNTAEVYGVEDLKAVDCVARPLSTFVNFATDGLALTCECDCPMCEEGSFGGFFNDNDDEVVEPDAKGVGGTPEQRAACKCFTNYEERLAALRRDYLNARIVVDRDKNLVREEVRREVDALFERLEAVSPPDWHPGSNDMMQDLIHPSMGCYVPSTHGAIQRDGEVAPFQWLPVDLKVDNEGLITEVCGRGFHGCPDAAAQTTLINVLNCMLPSMERVLNKATGGNGPHAVALKQRTIQVIAKMASCRLTPDKPAFPEGSWHLEGVAEEQIIATGILYPSSPNVGPSSLAFRVGGDEDPCSYNYPQCGYDYMRVHYGVEVTHDYHVHPNASGDTVFTATCDLGNVETTPGTVLVFPNNLQHKVSSYKLLDRSREGRRRVLVFWLIAPGSRIPSTVDVPDPTLGGTIKVAEAKAYRELLMLERKFAVASQSVVYERKVTLCEH